MHYTIYKITNKINGKFYIGKHQTKNLDDGYMGSGKLISRAISKYGLENFHKEILHIFDNEEDMNSKEKELVVISENSYNLCTGGQGGFSFINREKKNRNWWHSENPEHMKKINILANDALREKRKTDIVWAEKEKTRKSILMKKRRENGFSPNGTLGMKYTDESRRKMSFSAKGENNSQYGTRWMKNPLTNEKKKVINKDVNKFVDLGWIFGR